MRAEYKRDLQSNYLILSGMEEKGEEDYRIQMAERNKIPGLLRFHRSRTDGVLRLHYEITGKQPLSGLYEKKFLSSSDILFILTGINETLDNLQKFLLSPEQLVFTPEYIFVDSNDRKIQLCYVPGMENDENISALAEFILKRLDHQDKEAVALGYFFYQKTQEENFSLQGALRESLRRSTDRKMEKRESLFSDNQIEGRPWERQAGERAKEKNRDGIEEEIIHKTRRKKQDKLLEQDLRTDAGEKREEAEKRSQSSFNFQSSENSREKKKGFANWVFEKIHPAVLLSTLGLLAALEIVFYFGYLRLTEAGGVFFLILAAEMLANSRWRRYREEQEVKPFGRWAEEEQEESEEFSQLREEMYEKPEESFCVEETRCLTDFSPDNEVQLLLVQGREGFVPGQTVVEEIHLGGNVVIVGKLEGQCDVLLKSSTVSRVHARLERRGKGYFVKDLNSRNGTFLNGERLEPQEEREFSLGDRIGFAAIEYRVC